MTSGWQGAPHFRRYGRELASKPAISINERWGGYRRTTRGIPSAAALAIRFMYA